MSIQINRILFPTDFSADAGNALAYATSLAEEFGAELCVLHVVEDIVVPAYFGPQVDAGYIPTVDLEAAAQAELDKLMPDAETKPFAVRRLLRRGSPYLEIMAAAKDEGADLIVMGTHGHSGIAHLLLGSTAERVVRKSPVPVLTIRHPERPNSGSA